MTRKPRPATNATDPRPELRRRRATLPGAVVHEASRRVARKAWILPELARPRAIACYLAFGGEIDCGPIIREAWRRKRDVLLPVLSGRQLCFAPYAPDTPLLPNRFGIPEPVCEPEKLVRAGDLEAVLVPLVAFDSRGYRLGMGAGFYDRSFAFLLRRSCWLRPHLIGLAHDFQYIDKVPVHRHDVPLNVVITPSHTHRFTLRHACDTRAT